MLVWHDFTNRIETRVSSATSTLLLKKQQLTFWLHFCVCSIKYHKSFENGAIVNREAESVALQKERMNFFDMQNFALIQCFSDSGVDPLRGVMQYYRRSV